MDRQSKMLVGVLAAGLWALVLVLFFQPGRAEAQRETINVRVVGWEVPPSVRMKVDLDRVSYNQPLKVDIDRAAGRMLRPSGGVPSVPVYVTGTM